jgi:hypothetical protein
MWPFIKNKNVNSYNSLQINRLFFIAAIVLAPLYITACAGNHTAIPAKEIEKSGIHTVISAEEIEQYRDNQQKWLSDLHEGMSPEETLRQVSSYLEYFFQYKENGKLFQYIQGRYPATCMMFGLFFEDGKLTSLLLDRAVWDFDWYRYNYARVRGHLFQYWLPNGFQEGVSLIRQHNRLGDEYDNVSTECRQHVADKGGAAKASEAIITGLFFAPFLPYALVAMPLMQEDEITEEPDKIAKSRNKQRLVKANKIELGVTTTIELEQLLGTPDYKGDTMWTYRFPSIRAGIGDGVVIWSESQSTSRSQETIK